MDAEYAEYRVLHSHLTSRISVESALSAFKTFFQLLATAKFCQVWVCCRAIFRKNEGWALQIVLIFFHLWFRMCPGKVLWDQTTDFRFPGGPSVPVCSRTADTRTYHLVLVAFWRTFELLIGPLKESNFNNSEKYCSTERECTIVGSRLQPLSSESKEGRLWLSYYNLMLQL